MKKRFLIRKNCEYSLEVEADSEDEAMKIAQKTKNNDWSQAWSPYEFDEDESDLDEEVCCAVAASTVITPAFSNNVKEGDGSPSEDSETKRLR